MSEYSKYPLERNSIERNFFYEENLYLLPSSLDRKFLHQDIFDLAIMIPFE